jgi:hypothetical protein
MIVAEEFFPGDILAELKITNDVKEVAGFVPQREVKTCPNPINPWDEPLQCPVNCRHRDDCERASIVL